MKVKSIFEELNSNKNLEKCLHGQTQNRNESFNATIWEWVPKSKYVSLWQLEFGRKATILMFEKPGRYTLKCYKTLFKPQETFLLRVQK